MDQVNLTEIFRAVVVTLIPVIVYGFWFLVRSKASDKEMQQRFADLCREQQMVLNMVNERMDRIQRDIAYLRELELESRKSNGGRHERGSSQGG